MHTVILIISLVEQLQHSSVEQAHRLSWWWATFRRSIFWCAVSEQSVFRLRLEQFTKNKKISKSFFSGSW